MFFALDLGAKASSHLIPARGGVYGWRKKAAQQQHHHHHITGGSTSGLAGLGGRADRSRRDM
jgi:hypothetical protein